MKHSASPTASLRRAVELQPSLDSALGHLAAALLQQGREREAQLVFRKLASRADDPIERRFYSARALAMEGKTEEAGKSFAVCSLRRLRRPRRGLSSGRSCRTAGCSRRPCAISPRRSRVSRPRSSN